jgi:cell division protease FtsH
MGLESIQNRYLDGRPVQNCSTETAAVIDEETLKIIKNSHQEVVDLLRSHKDLLVKISERLLEKETLMGDEFMDMVKEG